MGKVCWTLAGCLAVALAGCQSTVDYASGSEPRGELADLAWLTGSWMKAQGDAISEEHWTRPAGQTMLGLNRTVISGRTVAFEWLRIESTPQGIVYFASPGGRHPPTPFGLVEQNGRRLVFENPDHDFPNRIIYERRGNQLDVRIEDMQASEEKTQQWSWRLTELGAMP